MQLCRAPDILLRQDKDAPCPVGSLFQETICSREFLTPLCVFVFVGLFLTQNLPQWTHCTRLWVWHRFVNWALAIQSLIDPQMPLGGLLQNFLNWGYLTPYVLDA